VARIGQKRQRVRLHPGNQLHHNEHSGGHQRPAENASGRLCVPVTVSVGVHPVSSVYTGALAAQDGSVLKVR
jgi:hypothetical protein